MAVHALGTQANTEVIRLARELTGREIVLMFDAKYHGEGDATLVIEEDGGLVPESRGLPAGIAAQARIVQFNDVAALEAALAPGDVALVLAEPAMTNAGFILPQPGFHEVLRRATRDAGTLLALDETHTLVCAYGGLGGDWGLEPDFLTLGKSIAAGVPLATYGMRDEVASLIAPPAESRTVSGAFVDEVATGGTLFANLLSMAAGRAALVDVLTEAAFEHTATLGAQMADGLRSAIGDRRTAVERGAVRRSRLLLLRTRHRPPTAPARAPPTTPACGRWSACSWRTAECGSPGGGWARPSRSPMTPRTSTATSSCSRSSSPR